MTARTNLDELPEMFNVLKGEKKIESLHEKAVVKYQYNGSWKKIAVSTLLRR